MPTHDQLIGELDLHLFAEGTHRRLWELLGPQPVGRTPDGVWATRISVWAPNALAVAVVGDWNDWTPEPLARVEEPTPSGIWSVVSNAPRPGHCYKFEITTSEGRTIRKADPMARQTEQPPSDASVVPSFDAFEWSDDEWMQRDSPERLWHMHIQPANRPPGKHHGVCAARLQPAIYLNSTPSGVRSGPSRQQHLAGGGHGCDDRDDRDESRQQRAAESVLSATVEVEEQHSRDGQPEREPEPH